MIGPELAARIRRFYFAEPGWIGTIASELGVHHETVAHVVGRERLGRPAGGVRPSALDPYKAFLGECWRSARGCVRCGSTRWCGHAGTRAPSCPCAATYARPPRPGAPRRT